MNAVPVSLLALTLVGAGPSAAWAQPVEPQPAPTPVAAAAPQAPAPAASPAIARAPRPSTGEAQTPAPAAPPAIARAPRPSTGEPQAPPPGAAPEVARAPRPRGQLANVRVDVTVTDQTGTGPAATKTMTLTVADGESAMIRNETEMKTSDGLRSAPFSVDVRAVIDGDRVRLDVGLDYQVLDSASTHTPGPPTRALFKGRQALVLESGKPLVISQSSDPMSDRKVTVEVRATIIR